MRTRLLLSLLPLTLGSAFVFAQDSAGSQKLAVSILQRSDPTSQSQGKAIYSGDQLQLKENDVLIIDEPARIYLKSADLQRGSQINTQGHALEIYVEDQISADQATIDVSIPSKIQDTSGSNGVAGQDGHKAADALKGAAGVNGTDASDGTSGSDAQSVTVITPVLQGDFILLARGGDGANGGSGGAGGAGGAGLGGMDARVLYHFTGLDNISTDSLLSLGTTIGIPYVGEVLAILAIFNNTKIGDGFDGFDGGKGGNGGHGGNGGNGGKGGSISLTFGTQVDGSKILTSSRGGVGGAGGVGGVGGLGGVGGAGGKAGDVWARDGKPGNAGTAGVSGVVGKSGTSSASGKVHIVQTDDPEWLKCYVRYRQILDVSEDPDFARDILDSCTG